jgi:nucleoside-diphosphate-sugar epimerase
LPTFGTVCDPQQNGHARSTQDGIEANQVVCVTGASGFIGTHVTRELLSRGYHVHAAVRDIRDETKTDHLRALPGNQSDRLLLFSADLMRPGSFDHVIAGCDAVFHVASAVYLAAKDPQREIVDVTVEGTRNVFASIIKAGTVRAVGLTSSSTAIVSTNPRPGYVYTERDWTDDATVKTNPYGVSKIEAERVASNIQETLPKSKRFSMMVVNPVLVTGPAYAKVHLRSSLSVVKDIMINAFRGCPNLGFGIVDVRDVVNALVDGVEQRITGRYLLHSEWLWVREIAETLAEEFPERRICTNRLPDFLLYLAAVFDRRLTWGYLRRNLGRQDQLDNRRVQQKFGLELRSGRQSIIDAAHSLIDRGLLR